MADNDEGQVRFLPEAFKKKRETRKAAPAAPAPKRAAAPAPAPAPVPPAEDEYLEEEVPLPFDDATTQEEFDEPIEEPAPAPTPAPRNDDRMDRLLDAMEAMRRENADLKRRLEQREQAPAPAPAPKAKRIDIAFEGAEVDEKKLAEEFPTLLPTVQAIARREVKALLERLAPQLEQAFDATEAAVKSVKEQTQEQKQQVFEREVRAAIPDFDTLNRNDAFQDYLDLRAPMQPRGVTLRAVVSHAWKSHDIDPIVEIVAAFKEKNPARQPQPAPQGQRRPNVEQFVQPSGQRGSAAPRNPANAGKLKQSDWNDARRKLGKGELTTAQYMEIKAKFEKAKSEGRLVDDTAAPASAA